MALSATTVQAQTTNTSKKTPTAKAKICTVEKKIEGDFRCDEAKVKKTAHRAGCAMKCDAKKVCKAVKCDETKVEKAAKKTCCKTKNVCQRAEKDCKNAIHNAKVNAKQRKLPKRHRRNAKKLTAKEQSISSVSIGIDSCKQMFVAVTQQISMKDRRMSAFGGNSLQSLNQTSNLTKIRLTRHNLWHTICKEIPQNR